MKKTGKGNLPAMIFLFSLLMLWQLGAMKVNAAYILPTPVQILEKLWELRTVLFTVHLPATMLVTLVGLLISLVLGLGLAVLMDASPFFRKAVYPIVVASQTIPPTAIAPLFPRKGIDGEDRMQQHLRELAVGASHDVRTR